MAYWFSGRSGESFTDKTLHFDKECPDLVDAPGGERPLAETSADVEAQGLCDECRPLGQASDGATDATGETCDVVKGDGEVCGRELPCQYHS